MNKQPKELQDGDILYENKFQQIKMINPNYPFTFMKCGCAIVLPYDKEGNIYLIHKFRPNIGTYYELPRGALENTESFIQGGIRELMEETGLFVLKARELGAIQPDTGILRHNVKYVQTLVEPMGTKEVNHMDNADKCTNRVTKFSLSEVFKLITDGEIICSYTMAGITKFIAYRKVK